MLYNSGAFNCTLWNWNDREQEKDLPVNLLLIVPYGIEMIILMLKLIALKPLLIVPYGIEIAFPKDDKSE